jgi:tRNA (guanine37-N1)-methyltransferase
VKFDVVTIFPDFIRAAVSFSIVKRAQESGKVDVEVHDLRDFTTDKHRSTDDTPYGGGAGMVMRPGPLFAAVEHIAPGPTDKVVLLSPQGATFTQDMARQFAESERVVLLCGHYEGFDERVREHLATDEVSVGDYVLTGGELPALTVIDAVARLIPGVLGNEGSSPNDSFSDGLLEHPHFTRPPDFRSWRVPDVLLSGNHAEIARWRRKEQFRRTQLRRPDLWAAFEPTKSDLKLIAQMETSSPSPLQGEGWGEVLGADPPTEISSFPDAGKVTEENRPDASARSGD